MTYRNALFSFLSRAAVLLVLAAPALANQTYVGVFLSPTTISVGGTSAFDMQLRENDGTAFTNGAITVTYPAGLVNDGQYGDPLQYENCTTESPGTVITRTAGTNQLIVTNVSLNAFRFCDIYVRVTSSTAGSYTITIPPGSFSSSTPSTTNSATTSTTLTVTGPIYVTNTADSGAGSLRDAITTVNGSCGTFYTGINFNIPGAGPHVINVLTALPAITCPNMWINGYSQPGSAQNGTLTGNSATIQVDVNGSACTGCTGLQLLANNIEVGGLAIRSFTGHGILSDPGGGQTGIIGSYIGTDASGMGSFGNGGAGVQVASGYAYVGTNSVVDSNLISNNAGGGVVVAGGAINANFNQVGGKRDGSAGNGNGLYGFYLNGANYSPNYITANRVISNGGPGIVVTAATFARTVVQNNLAYGNVGIGIDMNADGPNVNAEVAPDYDRYSAVQNYPVITSVIQSGGNTIVSGYMKSYAPNQSASVTLFANSSTSGLTEGEQIIYGPFPVALDITGNGTFAQPAPGTWNNISAQAILDTCGDGCIRSSEYSPKVAATNPLIVTNTNDSGVGSLRDAITFVNANCGAQTIAFNIPGGGVHTIQPASGALPALTCAGMAIDGYSQPGASVNTDPQASNAVILIELNGGLVPAAAGLNIAAANITIAGLSINGFNSGGYGVFVSATGGSGGIAVWGNFIGLAPDGTTVKPNAFGVATDSGFAGLTVGGNTSHAQRNVISGNTQGVSLRSGNGSLIQDNLIGTTAVGYFAAPNATGVYVSTTNTQIIYNVISGQSGTGVSLVADTGTLLIGNLIGLRVDGLAPIPNANGIQSASSSNILIGIPGTPNTIGGNIVDGINVQGSFGVTIQGNAIGTDPGSTQNLGNGGNGIFIDSSTSSIGGLGAGQGNLIAHNSQGVVVPSGLAEISANSIYGNTNLGINLVGGGATSVPPNDNCDVDGGGNGLANFPVLSSAAVNGATMTVTGTHNSTASTTFRIEVFSSPAAESASNRSGKVYLGFFTVTTDATCNASFSGSVNAAMLGDTVTATSTDPSGNTSSFSNGVVAAALAPAISSSTSSVSFGARLAGTSSSPSTVTLTNTGTAMLNFASFAFTGAAAASYSQTTTCGATLGVGMSCDVNVSFNPASVNTFGANLTIVSDASNAPTLNIPLTGTGAAPPTFALSMGTSLTPGQTTVVSILIQNQSGNTVTYSNFAATLTYPAGFVNAVPNASYPQGGCGANGSYTGGVAGGNTIGFSSSGSVIPGSLCSRAAMQVIAPATLGTYTFTIPAGGFTISSPFAYSNPAPISITVTVSAAPAPGVGFSPTSAGFASQLVGTSSASQPVTLTNTGNATLNITSISTTGDFSQTNACATSIAPSGTCTINVTFSPTAAGPRLGSLQVASNAAGSPHSVPLSGTGVAPTPTVSLTPGSLTFASRTVSTTSPAQTVTLANTGTGPLSIASITISGDFAFTSACGTTVAAGGSCTIDATFTPLVAGARSGTVTLTDNASGSPHTVPLSGTGLGGAAAVLNVSPGAVDFPAQPVGTDSAQAIVTVSNTGSAPLTFSGIGITGEFAIVTPTGATPPACPVTLVPGTTCRIAVVFHPTGPNLRQGVLSIATNGGSVSLNVIGTGLVPEPPQLVVPASIDFGSQPIGTRSTGHAVALRNTSPYVASVTELTASGDFAVSDACTNIAVGATCSPLVTFQPTAIGPSAGALTIRTLRDAGPYTVSLTGTGVENKAPVLELSATNIGFGNAFIAMAVTREVTLKNTGQAPLLVAGILVTGDYFTDGSCLVTLAPGGSCTVRITFFPTVPGGRNGVLEITSNAAGSPHHVSLGGTGCFIPTPSRARAGVLLCGG